ENIGNADPRQLKNIINEVFITEMEVNFEEIMNEDSDEEVLSDDSGCASDMTEYDTDRVEKFVPSPEIRALNSRTKHCMIQCYYTTDGPLTVCAACMILLADTDIDVMSVLWRIVLAWLQWCDECIERLEELCRAKRPRLAIGHRQCLVARIARLTDAKTQLERRFIHVGGEYASGEYTSGDERCLVWREIDTAFESRILTGVVINSNYIEPQRFLEDAREIVLEQVRDAVERHGNMKVNTAFNGEFVENDKRATKSINTKNIEIYRCTDLREWYERHVIEPTLASLKEFQERDSTRYRFRRDEDCIAWFAR
ncbi:hypothetical protein ALC60_01721, partial [Trachymyrmex zeteki]